MTAKKTVSKPTVEIFKMPRKEMNFFKTGQLYRLKFNDPNKYKVRFSAISIKQIDFAELLQSKKTLPNTFSSQLAKKFNVDFMIAPDAALHKSFLLNDSFICLETDATILRNFKSTIDGKNVEVSVFKQVPVFLFHSLYHHKPIIGSFQIDMNKQDPFELFGDQLNEVITPDKLIYIENFFEEIKS